MITIAGTIMAGNHSWCSEREAFTQCPFNIGPASKTVDQHCNSICLILRVCQGIIHYCQHLKIIKDNMTTVILELTS